MNARKLFAIVLAAGLVLAVSGTAGAALITDNLEAYWSFDTDFTDSTTNEYDGTANGDATITSIDSLLGGGALSLDGSGDWVEILGYEGVTGTTARTTAAWIKTNDGSGPILYWGRNQGGKKWGFRTDGGDIRTEVNGGWRKGPSGIDVTDDTWRYVVMVFPGDDGSPNVNDMLIYVDGELESPSSTGGKAINTASWNDVRIGRNQSNTYFDGLMDEVAIWDRVLTADEIATLYNAGDGFNPLAGPGPAITGYPDSGSTIDLGTVYYGEDLLLTAGAAVENTGDVDTDLILASFTGFSDGFSLVGDPTFPITLTGDGVPEDGDDIATFTFEFDTTGVEPREGEVPYTTDIFLAHNADGSPLTYTLTATILDPLPLVSDTTGNWHEATTWDPAIVPTDLTDVDVNDTEGTADVVTVQAGDPGYAGNLDIIDASSVVIDPDAELTVTGVVTVDTTADMTEGVGLDIQGTLDATRVNVAGGSTVDVQGTLQGDYVYIALGGTNDTATLNMVDGTLIVDTPST